MRDLTQELPGALCFDPTLSVTPRLRLRQRADPDGQIIAAQGLVVCPKWIHPTFDALTECTEHGLDLACIRAGRISALVRAQTRPDTTGLRRAQFRRHAQPASGLAWVKSLVAAKTAGQIAILRRAARQRPDPELGERADRCARDRSGLNRFDTIDAVRGLEGIIARNYFGGWPRLLALPSFQRVPRRALNPINHLLDICYSRLCLLVTLALIDRGFDLSLGILHVDDARRPTLALDLMEPLRPILADRFVLKCYADALSAGWLQEQGSRWVMTPLGHRRFRQRWTAWIYGSARRAGRLHLVTDLINAYHTWIIKDEIVTLPSHPG